MNFSPSLTQKAGLPQPLPGVTMQHRPISLLSPPHPRRLARKANSQVPPPYVGPWRLLRHLARAQCPWGKWAWGGRGGTKMVSARSCPGPGGEQSGRAARVLGKRGRHAANVFPSLTPPMPLLQPFYAVATVGLSTTRLLGPQLFCTVGCLGVGGYSNPEYSTIKWNSENWISWINQNIRNNPK